MQTKVQSGMAAAWYTPDKQNLPEDKQRSYEYKPLDGLQCLDIEFDFSSNRLTLESMDRIVKRGLVGWKNIVVKGTDEPVEFEFALIGLIPCDEIKELAYEICAVSNLTEREVKN